MSITSQLGQTRFGGLSHSIFFAWGPISNLRSNEFNEVVEWPPGALRSNDLCQNENKSLPPSELEPTILGTWSGHFTFAPTSWRGSRTRTWSNNLASSIATLYINVYMYRVGASSRNLWPLVRGTLYKSRDIFYHYEYNTALDTNYSVVQYSYVLWLRGIQQDW